MTMKTPGTTYEAEPFFTSRGAYQRAEGRCIRLTPAGWKALEAVMIEGGEVSAELVLDRLLVEQAGQILVGQVRRKLAEKQGA